MAVRRLTTGRRNLIDNPQRLEEVMQKTARGVVTAVSKDVERKIKDETISRLYNGYKPKIYDRTYEFYDSITRRPTYRISSGYRSEVFFDYNKMKPYPPRDGLWGKHTNFDGNDVRKELIGWLDTVGTMVVGPTGHVIYKREPLNIISDTREWLDNIVGSIDTTFSSYRNPEIGQLTKGLRITKKK